MSDDVLRERLIEELSGYHLHAAEDVDVLLPVVLAYAEEQRKQEREDAAAELDERVKLLELCSVQTAWESANIPWREIIAAVRDSAALVRGEQSARGPVLPAPEEADPEDEAGAIAAAMQEQALPNLSFMQDFEESSKSGHSVPMHAPSVLSPEETP